MSVSIKSTFLKFLTQLSTTTAKIPEELFSVALSDDMFCLAMNAKIAANFALRGYCPLLNQGVISFEKEGISKASVKQQIDETINYLNAAPDVTGLSDKLVVHEKAGFNDIELTQPEFIHHYILPNFFFHISMVYAIARSNGVALGKGDFDGIHSYPPGFSFQAE